MLLLLLMGLETAIGKVLGELLTTLQPIALMVLAETPLLLSVQHFIIKALNLI